MHRRSTRASISDPLLNPADQIVVPVLGMHRCGTSLTTRLLDLLGMELGWPLQPPSHDNPKGFWEHRVFQSVNIQILEGLGGNRDGYGTPQQLMDVAKKASQTTLPPGVIDDLRTRLTQHFMHPQWGFKDPRSAVLWPLWRRLLPALGYTQIRPVLVVRDPSACVQSLQRRGDVAAMAQAAQVPLPAYIGAMWGAYYQVLLKSGLADMSPLIVCQEDLLRPDTARTELARMAKHIGVGLENIDEAMDWVDVRLDHRAAGADGVAPHLQKLYQALRGLSERQRASFVAHHPQAVSVPVPVSPAAISPAASHCIFVVSPLGYPASRCFDEVALALHHGLEALGIHAPIVTSPDKIQGTPIVLGGHQVGKFIDTSLAALKLPEDAIIYNLEQVDDDSTWIDSGYLALMRRFRVWDYSAANVVKLKSKGVEVAGICGVGHVVEHERIADFVVKDIDVLFYGSVNERRRKILDDLTARGLRVVVSTNLYGSARDSLVARAKVVLNVHFYAAKVLELVRLSYLLANRVAVVSEPGADSAEAAALCGAIAFAPYDGLVARCVELVNDPEAAKVQGERAQKTMRARPQSEILKELIK
jgi:hypothetical protein